MPVCIAGMHRSGTSLVANLLHRCGLYLGNESQLMPATVDNERGYWENLEFVDINEAILRALGASWDAPPVVPEGWPGEESFNPLRIRAEKLIEEFRDHEPWGWKDPRNSLTLPFWESLAGVNTPFWRGLRPKMKVVLCLRNPVEVAGSLQRRTFGPSAGGLTLWLTYNLAAMNSTLPEDRIITLYDAYLDDAQRELRRVLSFLNMPVSEMVIAQSSLEVSSDLCRTRSFPEDFLSEEVSSEISDLYRAMRLEASKPASHSAGQP